MLSSWFRVHLGMMDNPKIMSLNDRQFRLWMQMLDAAARAEEPGVIGPYTERGMGELLRVGRKTLHRALGIMTILGIATMAGDETEFGVFLTIRITNFAKRQYLNAERQDDAKPEHRKPSGEPERVRDRVKRFRTKATKQGVTEDVVTPSEGVTTLEIDVDVTPESRTYAQAEQAEAEPFLKEKAEQAEFPLSPTNIKSEPSAPAALPAFVANDVSAPASASASPGGLLTNFNISELLKLGPPGGACWSLQEITLAEQILLERKKGGKEFTNPAGLLRSSILAEVRAGRRPKRNVTPLKGVTPSVTKPIIKPSTVELVGARLNGAETEEDIRARQEFANRMLRDAGLEPEEGG